MELTKKENNLIKGVENIFENEKDIYLANLMPKKRGEYNFYVFIDKQIVFSNQDILDKIKSYEHSDMIIFDKNMSVVAISIFAMSLNAYKFVDSEYKTATDFFKFMENEIKNNFGYINKF